MALTESSPMFARKKTPADGLRDEVFARNLKSLGARNFVTALRVAIGKLDCLFGMDWAPSRVNPWLNSDELLTRQEV